MSNSALCVSTWLLFMYNYSTLVYIHGLFIDYSFLHIVTAPGGGGRKIVFRLW